MSTRANITAKLPIIFRAQKVGSGERPSVRPPGRGRGLPFAPRIVGRYLVCDAFAAGGMATLHLGRLMGPEGFSRTVAIKQLHPQYAHDPRFCAMFLDEARLASRVHHPNVVSPLDVISHPPDLFMVMDYVHSEPLSRLLKRGAGQPVSPRIAAAVVGQVLLGLHAAHEATGEGGEPLELVHRDVSPHNVLVTKDGVAKVVDFGIAKAKARTQQTERGMLKGKLGYMSPEQLKLEAVDRRADVFAVGVVLWEMLTGRRLFEGDTPDVVLGNLMELSIPRPSSVVPSLPPDLDEVVMAALSRSPAERFANAHAMARALDYATPSASMLELAAWVEERAGDELSARAELVLDVEALRFDDFTRSGGALAPGTPPPRSSQEAAPSLLQNGEPSALSVTEPPSKPRRPSGAWLLPAALLLAGSFWALWRGPGAEREAERSAAPSLVALPAPVQAVDSAPLRAPSVTLPAAPPSLAAPAGPPLRELAAAAPAALRPPAAKPTGSDSVAAPRSTKSGSGSCDVPYTLDRHGVKRFKEACF